MLLIFYSYLNYIHQLSLGVGNYIKWHNGTYRKLRRLEQRNYSIGFWAYKGGCEKGF